MKQFCKVFVGRIDVGTNNRFKYLMEKKGYKVTTCSTFVSTLGFENDICFNINPKDNMAVKIGKAFGPTAKILFNLNHYDIFHFRGGTTLLPLGLDLPILKLFGKKIIMQYEGSDLRQMDHFQKDKYNRMLVANLKTKSFRGFQQRLRYAWIRNWTDKIIVSTPDLLQFACNAEYIPNFVSSPENGFEHKDNKTVELLHAPTNRKIKGTAYLIKAVKRLKKEKFSVNLVLLEKIAHSQINRYYQKADVVIDQLFIGAYGVVSIEGMSFGKPIVCYIREDLRKYYPKELPIASANPDDIYEILKNLVTSKKLRQKVGKNSQKYFKKYHGENMVGKKWQKIYQNLLK